MTKATSIQNGEHYSWGDGCDGWFLLKGQDMHIIQERMPPGTWEKRHVHSHSRQFFYVLRGELTMILGQDRVGLQPGEGLEIEPQVAHQAGNTSQNDVEFIVLSCPPSHDDRMSGALESFHPFTHQCLSRILSRHSAIYRNLKW